MIIISSCTSMPLIVRSACFLFVYLVVSQPAMALGPVDKPNPSDAQSPRCRALASKINNSASIWDQMRSEKEFVDSGCGCPPTRPNYDPMFKTCDP